MSTSGRWGPVADAAAGRCAALSVSLVPRATPNAAAPMTINAQPAAYRGIRQHDTRRIRAGRAEIGQDLVGTKCDNRRHRKHMVWRILLTGVLVAAAHAPAITQTTVPPPGVTDVLVQFTASDGTPLVGKLSLPAQAAAPPPVVFFLHGAGPRNYDHPLRYRESDGQIRITNYYDYHARELAKRGVALFRISKRGCAFDAAGVLQVDRAIFSKATSTVLIDDYSRALEALRARKDVDTSRIILMGASEGTRLAPQLALRAPAGIVGLSLMSFQPDNIHDTVVWQNTVGVWRAITFLIPGAADGTITRAEYDEALKTNASIAQRFPFAPYDADKDGTVTRAETLTLLRPRLDAILKAVDDRNDDFVWQSLLNLSSAYLLDGWTADPTRAFLLKLSVPVGIFHGELDGTTRVEGVRETDAAFKSAGKTTLTVRTYPGLDHDLGWTIPAAKGDGPQPFQDAFAFAATVARSR